MTKKQELEILGGAIARLGPDSYIGPWLAQERPGIERDLLSDIQPVVTWRDSVETAGAQGQAIVEQAKHDAAKIVADAEREAKQIRANRDAALQYGYSALESAMKRLHGYT